MSRTIEYLDQDASPVTSELHPGCNLIVLSGEIVGSTIALVDADGNEFEFVVEQDADGLPIFGERSTREER